MMLPLDGLMAGTGYWDCFLWGGEGQRHITIINANHCPHVRVRLAVRAGRL